MTLRKQALTEKVFVLGVDGLDPRYSRKRLREGKMPNLQKFIDAGSCREDLVLLGGHPTVTPPMWTTLATGCYANVHGITAFNRQGSDLDKTLPNFDSRNCKAEPMWNVLVEEGIKTCVFHWPGNAWPPTSDNENLFVCDGSTPGGLGMGAASLSSEFMAVADVKIEEVTFAPSATADLDRACVVKPDKSKTVVNTADGLRNVKEKASLILSYQQGMGSACVNDTLSLALSPVKEPHNWSYDTPAGAKEFTLLLSQGMIRRPGLILQNENGIYDRVALYKSKKEAEPFVILEAGKIKGQIYDQAVVGDGEYKKDGKSIVDLRFIAGQKIAWDLAFLLACVMAISSALTNDATGVKPFLAGVLNPIFNGMSPFVMFAVMLAVCLVLTNFANNGVIALLLLPITYITTASMNIPNIGYFVSALAFTSQTALLIPGSSIYGAMIHGNDWVSAGFVYKTTICVVIMAFLIFLAFWPLSLIVY